MTGLEIRDVDVHDDVAMASWHAATVAAAREGLGDAAMVWTLPEVLAQMREPSRRFRQVAVVGVVDDEVVASGLAVMPLLDNVTSARVEVGVPAVHRRRGHGSAVLAHLEARVACEGRTRLDGESAWPHDVGPDGEGWPGREFARRHGYELALGDVQRALDLPVGEALLARLAAEAAPHHTAYTLRSWVGPIPDDLVLSWLALSTTLMTQAPMGDREVEDETVDLDAHREGERVMAKQGRTRYNTVALDATGEVVAYSDVATTVHEPGKVYQWGTLVRGADRGHRLGLAVKVANLQLLQRERADVRTVTTWNAEVNAHMIGVNEQLGFRVQARLGEFQKIVAVAP